MILEDLYMGDIHPSERRTARDEVIKAGDALIAPLTDKQKEHI